MKQWMSMLLAIAMLLTMTACGEKEEPETVRNNDTQETTQTTLVYDVRKEYIESEDETKIMAYPRLAVVYELVEEYSEINDMIETYVREQTSRWFDSDSAGLEMRVQYEVLLSTDERLSVLWEAEIQSSNSLNEVGVAFAACFDLVNKTVVEPEEASDDVLMAVRENISDAEGMNRLSKTQKADIKDYVEDLSDRELSKIMTHIVPTEEGQLVIMDVDYTMGEYLLVELA